MKPLNAQERHLIDRILSRIPRRGLTNYLAYKQTNGFMPMDYDQVDLTYKLFNKGWLENYSDLFEQNAVWLSHAAWKKLSLADWEEVEEQALKDERGEIYGSW